LCSGNRATNLNEAMMSAACTGHTNVVKFCFEMVGAAECSRSTEYHVGLVCAKNNTNTNVYFKQKSVVFIGTQAYAYRLFEVYKVLLHSIVRVGRSSLPGLNMWVRPALHFFQPPLLLFLLFRGYIVFSRQLQHKSPILISQQLNASWCLSKLNVYVFKC